jgi:hypothetical protein
MPEKKKEEESNYFSYFKKLYESWEKSTSQALDVWLKSPLFTNSMERAVEKSIEFKNYIQDTMERNLRLRYVPIKNDSDRVAISLDKINQKLNLLEEKIKSLETTPSSTKEKKQTRPKTARRKKIHEQKL